MAKLSGTDITGGVTNAPARTLEFTAATYNSTLFNVDGSAPGFPYTRAALALLRHVHECEDMPVFLKGDFCTAAYVLRSAGDRYASPLDDAAARRGWDKFSKEYWRGDAECIAVMEEVRRGFGNTFH